MNRFLLDLAIRLRFKELEVRRTYEDFDDEEEEELSVR